MWGNNHYYCDIELTMFNNGVWIADQGLTTTCIILFIQICIIIKWREMDT